LTFNVGGRIGGLAALMTIEDRLENVGQTVALNVLLWEELIPEDTNRMARTATARHRLAEWCDFHRHLNQGELPGFAVFPRDPLIENLGVGTTMAIIRSAEVHGKDFQRLDGAVSLVLVGCVCYRSSFEPMGAPTHPTRFIYSLMEPRPEGLWMPYIFPQGIAERLVIMPMPVLFTVD
jgi:hypothetical protein